jgi:hypothetical protein
VSLGVTREKLGAVGVETLAVVATPADRARRYFKLRPPRCTVAADAELATHRAYGVPQTAFTDELMQVAVGRVDGLAREMGFAVAPGGGLEALNGADGIDTAEHEPDVMKHQALMVTQFLIDREGVIRWVSSEGAAKGPATFGVFPSDEELLAAARAL